MGEFVASLEPELIAIERAVAAGRSQLEEEDALDNLYRRGHRLAGLAELFGVPKIAHLLAILGVGLDAGRSLSGFQRFSLSYVVQLLADSVRRIAGELQKTGASSQDVSEIVLECMGYVERAVAEACLTLAAPAPAFADSAPEPPAPKAAPPAAVPLAFLPPVAAVVDDGPEDLDIPTDKIGLISDFCEEARDNLDQIGQALVELERSNEPMDIVNALFRAFHTVKGGARMLRIRKLEKLAHELENCLDQVRAGHRSVSPTLIDALLAGRDVLSEMVDEVASRGRIRVLMAPVLALLDGLDQPAAASTNPLPASVVPAPPVGGNDSVPAVGAVLASAPESEKEGVRASAAKGDGETIRIATEKLDDVLNTASEIFISRIRIQNDAIAIGVGISELSESLNQGRATEGEGELERTYRRDDRMLEDIEEVLTGRDRSREQLVRCLKRVSDRLSARGKARDGTPRKESSFQVLSLEQTRKRLEKNVEHLEQLSSRLQHGAMSFRMVPIASLFTRFPTQVRTIARQLGKNVRLDIRGEQTQLDKVLMGNLSDPLLHLLRNSLDHGLETPQERVAAGKSETGLIVLSASYQGSYAVIEISDDGRGIDTKKVLERALARGLVDPARATHLEASEILDFIFEPGFSTVDAVSEMSGRGVGMDVVRSSIHRIQGTVSLHSEPGKGARVTLRLPLTLAVVWIVLVEEGPHRFAFPLLDVNEIIKIQKSEITELSSGLFCSYRGKTLPLSTLSTLLGFPANRFAADEVFLVILSEGGRQVGIIVEAIVGRQEVLIKNLGGVVRKIPFVIGCTILSDSRLVLILNPRELVVAATSSHHAGVLALEPSQVEDGRRARTILVVDDSAIQRKYLRGVLESAGYSVSVEANGFEALKAVDRRPFDAALVDIVMPLMDGFEFVEQIRKQRETAGLPVFYVTSRRNAEDRERAATLGALGYYEKPVDAKALIDALDQCCLPRTVIRKTPVHSSQD